jgi:hypothetical protein
VRTSEQWDQVDDREGPSLKASLQDGRSLEAEAKYIPYNVNQLH